MCFLSALLAGSPPSSQLGSLQTGEQAHRGEGEEGEGEEGEGEEGEGEEVPNSLRFQI